jgi:hypothetical protein
MTDDPLEGFRSVRAVAREIEHADPDSELWGRLYLGDAASKIMRGVANREDITKVMASLIAQCELDTQDSCRTLLEQTSLNDPAALKAHFDARISAGIVGRINQFVRDGFAASEFINNPTKE